MRHFLLPLFFLLCFACTKTEETSRKEESPRRKKMSKLISPKLNTTFKLGESIDFEIALSDSTSKIDSISLEAPTQKITFQGSKFTWTATQPRVGTPKIKLTVFFKGKKESIYPKIKVLPIQAPAEFTYRVIETFPHDDEAYTQGLFWHEGFLWESTGKRGYSSIRKVNLDDGKSVKLNNLSSSFFGEGAAILNNKIFQVTWNAQQGFIYDTDLEQIGEFRYGTEGWGLTTLGDRLIMSDGSEKLYILDAESFTEVDRLQVFDDQGAVSDLNELENVDGKIYANVYGQEYIVVIDPETGAVEAKIDLTGLWPRDQANSTLDYVLNGIAYFEEDKRLFVTGKYWPNLFEVQTIRRGNQP